MNIRNTIIEHYRKFFDLHAKGITLDEDDHLNIDWAEDLVKNCFIPNVSNRRELLIKFCDALFEQNGTQITNVQIDFLMRKFNL